MKKLLLLFFSLLAFGYMFQACDNSKTYAEMLDEEKDAVNAFIKKHNIQTISESDFEANGYKNGYDQERITWLSQTESTCKLWIRV